jgi:hypothetical protein
MDERDASKRASERMPVARRGSPDAPRRSDPRREEKRDPRAEDSEVTKVDVVFSPEKPTSGNRRR